MPENEVFTPCSIEHQDVFMYDDERTTNIKCERADSPTYLDISSNKTAAAFPHIKSGTSMLYCFYVSVVDVVVVVWLIIIAVRLCYTVSMCPLLLLLLLFG